MVEMREALVMSGVGDITIWLELIHDTRWTRQQKCILLNHFGCPAAVLQLETCQLRAVLPGIKTRPRRSVDGLVARDMHWLKQHTHHLIPLFDPRYPENLQHIPDPPLALYAKGNVDLLAEPGIAMVGSRRPTPLGQQIARKFAGDLAQQHKLVISGMALGVDGLAHEAALEVNGSTIAVLGSGLAKPSPARHAGLFARIAAKGLVLSEYAIDQHATRYSFPERNRIISGLSKGVIVVEAAARSGTLITARLAAEQGREVLVVPGSILNPQYHGSHSLIQQGAALVQSVEDVLHAVGWGADAPLPNAQSSNLMRDLPPECAALLQHIAPEETHVDALILATGLTPGEVSSMLMTLELAGAIAPGNCGGYINISQQL